MNLTIPDEVQEMLPYSETWQRVDSTKAIAWNECRRKYFYEYILGWRPQSISNHLVFGNAWHSAMEVIHEEMNFTEPTIAKAYSAAEAFYREEFPPETDELYVPKTMDALLVALCEYANTYQDDFSHIETRYVEVGGSVPIRLEPTERRVHFRMDALLHDKKHDYYFCREHKTGSSGRGLFRNQWRDDFSLRLQIGTYTHAMYCIFPREKVRGVEVNGAFFTKTKSEPFQFERVQAWWQSDRMAQWLWLMNCVFDEIEYELEALAQCSPDDQILQAFPLNPCSCNNYNGCPYHTLCTSLGNPLGEPLPMGFKVEHWDPQEIKSIKHKMEL